MSQDFQGLSAHQADVLLPMGKAAVMTFCLRITHMYTFIVNTTFPLPALHLFPFKTANFGNLPWEFKIFGKTNNVPLCFNNFLYECYVSSVVCFFIKKIVLEENLKILRKAWQNWNKITFGKKTLNIIQDCQASSHTTFRVD